eukprot:42263-Eustigmatos_ZCMA.PRE.1
MPTQRTAEVCSEAMLELLYPPSVDTESREARFGLMSKSWDVMQWAMVHPCARSDACCLGCIVALTTF